MTENLTQLLLARADERPDLRIGTVDEQLTLPHALARAAGGARELRALGLDEDQRVALVATSRGPGSNRQAPSRQPCRPRHHVGVGCMDM
jgi:hypothetical protein